MIIFKENQKIAFNGIDINEFTAGIGYELDVKEIEKLEGFGIDFITAEDEQLELTDAEKEGAIDLATVIVAEENIEAADAVLEDEIIVKSAKKKK